MVKQLAHCPPLSVATHIPVSPGCRNKRRKEMVFLVRKPSHTLAFPIQAAEAPIYIKTAVHWEQVPVPLLGSEAKQRSYVETS